MKELILIIAVFCSIYCMYISLERINKFDQQIGIPKREKFFLKYISILVPIVGFILTNKMKKVTSV